MRPRERKFEFVCPEVRLLDVTEASLLDESARVACNVATVRHPLPEWVDDVLESPHPGAFVPANVLDVVEPAALHRTNNNETASVNGQ